MSTFPFKSQWFLLYYHDGCPDDAESVADDEPEEHAIKEAISYLKGEHWVFDGEGLDGLEAKRAFLWKKHAECARDRGEDKADVEFPPVIRHDVDGLPSWFSVDGTVAYQLICCKPLKLVCPVSPFTSDKRTK